MIKMTKKDKNKLKSGSKILVLVLILFVLIGLFGPMRKVNAELCTSFNRDTNKWLPEGCTGTSDPATTTPTTTTTPPPATPYNLLAPLPSVNGGDPMSTFDPTQANNLSVYLNLMIKLFIGICAVLAVVMIVMGGIEYMTSELISSKQAGKDRILHAIFGLLLALGAWTLLNTINPNLLNADLSNLKKVTVEVALNDNVPQTYDPATKKYNNGSTYGADWTSAGTLANLTTSGATVYNAQCTTVGQSNCTSTRGLNPSTLNAIHQGCPSCVLLVTGGTEFWLHGGKTGSTTHQINSSTIDLDPNPALNNYLSGGRPLVAMTRYPPPNGPNLYEGNHWHIGS